MSLLRQAIRSCAPSLYTSRHRLFSAQAAFPNATSDDAQRTGGFGQNLDASGPKDSATDSVDSDATEMKPKRRRRTVKTVTDENGEVRERKPRKKADLEEEPQRNPLEPGQTELWLQSLQNAGLAPSLREDLDKLRRSPPGIGSPNYGEQYDDLLDTVTRTFSAAQLSSFCQQLGFPYYKRRKMELAESILGYWSWRPPREIERRIREETEILPQSTCCLAPANYSAKLFYSFSSGTVSSVLSNGQR